MKGSLAGLRAAALARGVPGTFAVGRWGTRHASDFTSNMAIDDQPASGAVFGRKGTGAVYQGPRANPGGQPMLKRARQA